MENLKINDYLENGKIYSIWIEVGTESTYEGKTQTTFAGSITCTSDKILTYELLCDIFSALKDGWTKFTYFNIIKFSDVTNDTKILEEMNQTIKSFDWDKKSHDEFEELNNKLTSLENKIFPNVMCSIDINKTI